MIAADGLTYRYGDAVALDGVSLSIDDGEFVVLAGANGSGKTTLVRHFNGLLSPDEGDVRVDGESVEDNPVLARTTVGMVFQNPRDCFVAATVAEDVAFGPENLGLPREEIDSRVVSALDAVDMADQREARIDRLSGGEQARVAIAGALAMEPDHLVLDEPFTGLDWPAQNAVLERLDELSANGTSIVVVTHDLRDLLKRADRVVALADGRIAFDEPPESARERLEDADIRPC
ncbi:energy-coupling factor ABC transporter ATP-binding protein [Natronomonas sp.]|uniref:energy-coupling factor ABC transporter ATP-binding protein n=1 Tax=Natronomonas sp. TaxID=2184060 RepID=UPI002FC3D4F6